MVPPQLQDPLRIQDMTTCEAVEPRVGDLYTCTVTVVLCEAYLRIKVLRYMYWMRSVAQAAPPLIARRTPAIASSFLPPRPLSGCNPRVEGWGDITKRTLKKVREYLLLV